MIIKPKTGTRADARVPVFVTPAGLLRDPLYSE